MVPALQMVHEEAPFAEYLPTTQEEQFADDSDAVELEKVPEGQAVQLIEPVID
jgi:hypothetical protein